MSSEVTVLGTLLPTDGVVSRDAVHVAVAPVKAGQILRPGEHVGFLHDDNHEVVGRSRPHLGVVDPFLKVEKVMPGERFYLFLYPQTITGLAHVWEHPAFPKVKEEAELILIPAPSPSEKWLRDFAAQWGVSYETVLAAGDGNETIYSGDYEADVPEEFWFHYRTVTGRDGSHEHFFRCAC